MPSKRCEERFSKMECIDEWERSYAGKAERRREEIRRRWLIAELGDKFRVRHLKKKQSGSNGEQKEV